MYHAHRSEFRLLVWRLHRQLLTKVGQSNFVKIREFTIDLGEAKAYLYKYSTRHRILKWEDLNISVLH